MKSINSKGIKASKVGSSILALIIGSIYVNQKDSCWFFTIDAFVKNKILVVYFYNEVVSLENDDP